jgi:hypothetical protein
MSRPGPHPPHIAVHAFAYSIIFVFLAPVITNRLAILVRTRNR